MGIIYLALAGFGFVVGSVAMAFAILVTVKGRARSHFWPTCAVTTILSAVLLYAVALDFFQVPSQGLFLTLALKPLFGWHLLPPFVVAALLLLIAPRPTQGTLLGIAAGLFYSVTVIVVLAVPIAFIVAPSGSRFAA